MCTQCTCSILCIDVSHMTTDQHEAVVKCYELGRQVPASMVDGKVLLYRQ